MQQVLTQSRTLAAKCTCPIGGHLLRPSSSVQSSVGAQHLVYDAFKGRDTTKGARFLQRDERQIAIRRDIVATRRPLIATNAIISDHLPLEGFTDLLSEGTSMLFDRVPRVWENVQTAYFDGQPLRVCSYNVLCQKQIARTAFLYQHLLSSFGREYQLTWEYRSTLLAREFSMIDADVLCLQEVQYDHYKDFYEPTLTAAGYTGVYKRRTGAMIDGCAIFYRSNLELVAYRPLDYRFHEYTHLNKDNIGQLVRFKVKNNDAQICVFNTHLVFNKRLGDVKLAQTAVLLAILDEECCNSSEQQCPYIICGDFNMEPYSPMYNFFTGGSLSFENLKQFEVSGQGEFGGLPLEADILPSSSNIGYDCRFGGKRSLI
ncbi:Protein angel -like protein 1 [Toxocara canis]|uniref:Protein angel-like protein 1 n=1 Tax=Toxocara canis TaxID=6265 RepID=A0A0B2VGR3_TOXCA|nr:Protein angel -like protein 1 [Toxocara canis]